MRKNFYWDLNSHTYEHSSELSFHFRVPSSELSPALKLDSAAKLLVAYQPYLPDLELLNFSAIVNFLFQFWEILCPRDDRCIDCYLLKFFYNGKRLKSFLRFLLRSNAICIMLIFWFSNSISLHFRVICDVINSLSLIKLSSCFFSFSIPASLS